MPIDTSIYQSLRPVETPDMMGTMAKAMTLRQLAMQNSKLQREDDNDQALKTAYAKNIGPDGKLNEDGYVADVGKLAGPSAAFTTLKGLSDLNKSKEDAKSAHMDVLNKVAVHAFPVMDRLAGMSEEERAKEYDPAMKYLEKNDVPMNNVPKDQNGNYLYDPGHFATSFNAIKGSPDVQAILKSKFDLENNQKKAPLERGEISARTAKDWAETNKIKSESDKRQPNLMGQTNDPAKLVPSLVPKEHQAAVFKEIDAAENTKKMASSIMSSFENAVNDTRGIGRLTSLVKTPRSSEALHQAMQPTFKDLEGTVRQAAMDNTFKNITPNGADTDADIQTKRQALQDYLQSKASTPIARAYGIDLGRFDSTSPYASNKNKPSVSSMGMQEANASTGDDDRALKPPHGPFVVQGGHKFNWNPSTGKYE